MTRDALLLELEAARAQLLDSQRDLAVERARRTAAEQALSERSTEIERLLAENAELRQRVDLLARKMFGKSSEKLHPQQLSLLFETALEQESAAHAEDARETALGEETPATPKPKRVRPSQKPAHKDLPVREVRIDPPSEQLRCGCGHHKTRIGEESSEVVDYVPASCHVVRTVRGKYACPACQDGVVIAPLPPQAIEKSVAGPGLIAHIATSKFADHLPLYRLEGILARNGVDLSRSTMGDLLAATADRLEPIALAILRSVLAGRVVHTDDTPVTYLNKEKGSSTGYVWTYVGEKGEVAYEFTAGRGRDGPAQALRNYKGYLQADALAVYDAIYAASEIIEVACWAHTRRYFFEAEASDKKRSDEALALIGRLYAIEARARGLSEPERKLLRLEHAKPVLGEFLRWMDAVEPTVLPKGPIGKAIAYARKNWTALNRYLDEGYLDIDNNAAERALRCVAVGRKNWLFAGSADAGRRAAVLMSLVNSCKLAGVDPQAYLKDVLLAVASVPMNQVERLTPRGWKAARDAAN